MPIITANVLETKITDVYLNLTNGTIILKLATGYEDGNVFKKLSEQELPIGHPETEQLFASTVDGTKNIYENVKISLYQFLIDQNIVTGTIE